VQPHELRGAQQQQAVRRQRPLQRLWIRSLDEGGTVTPALILWLSMHPLRFPT
jgi:hypothetical protein